MATNRIGNRTAAELKKFYRKILHDDAQPVSVRMRAAAKLQKLYDLDSPEPPAPYAPAITRADALAAIKAVSGE
jgi:hypothetical protein